MGKNAMTKLSKEQKEIWDRLQHGLRTPTEKLEAELYAALSKSICEEMDKQVLAKLSAAAKDLDK